MHEQDATYTALTYYRKLCQVVEPGDFFSIQNAVENRVSALSILREAFRQDRRLGSVLRTVALGDGEVTSGEVEVVEQRGLASTSSALLELWRETLQNPVTDEEEHIFLERRWVGLKDGGGEYFYRLSPLGELLMAGLPKEVSHDARA